MSNVNKPDELNKSEDDRISLSARFKARRAILNAQIQAKVSDGTFTSRLIIDRGLILPKDYHLEISDESLKERKLKEFLSKDDGNDKK